MARENSVRDQDDDGYDYDVIVVGSGFGGSVAALRLAEKGYRVAVLEAGRRFRPEDFPKTSWDVRNFLWAPRLGLRGIFRLTIFRDVAIASGCGGRQKQPTNNRGPRPARSSPV